MPTDNTEDWLDYLDEPEYCCDGSDCGCEGKPIEPPELTGYQALEARNRKLEEASKKLLDLCSDLQTSKRVQIDGIAHALISQRKREAEELLKP